MSNEKMFFDQFKELLNESEEPKKHEASHTNLKKYMETEKASYKTDEVPVSDDPLDEGLKGDMGEEVTREEMGDSLKGYEEGELYDIIKFLKGYKAETISNAIEKMKKWKLDSFNESKLSREMGLNEAQEAFHGKQKSGDYVGSKKVAGIEVDYYVKYKVAGKSKTVDRFEARFGKDKDDVLIVSGRALTREDKLFGHLYNKFSDKIKKDNSKETPAMTKKREENYKEFEDAIKNNKK